MIKRKHLILTAALLVVLPGCTLFSIGTTSPKDQPIRFGYNADISTGGAKDHGLSAKQGFEIAINDINSEGGLLGRPVKGVIMDDQAKPDRSRQNAEKLIHDYGVAGIIGPVNSGNALRWYDLAQQNHVVTISPVASASVLTTQFADQPQNYNFRVSMVDREQARLYVAWAIRETDNGKLAVIHDSTGYGQQGAADFREILKLWGKTPVAEEQFDRGESQDQLAERIRRVRAAGADGVLLFCLADSTADLLRAFDSVGYWPVLFGPWSSLASDLPEGAGDLAGRIIFTASTTFDANKRTRQLAHRTLLEYGKTPIFTTVAQGYDATMLLAEAIRQAGTTDGPQVQRALENLETPYKGIIKEYDRPFSKTDHEALSVDDFHLAQWSGGLVTRYVSEDVQDLEIR